MITICFTYFKSLALANLSAALYSVRQQNLTHVQSLIVFDNDTSDSYSAIESVVKSLDFSIPVFIISEKHGDPNRTHSWSTNQAVHHVKTKWIVFTRADYLLDFGLMQQFTEIIAKQPAWWNGFLTANVYHLHADIGDCETTTWRKDGPFVLRRFVGVENDYTKIDSGVWMARKSAFDGVGGMNESLVAWGHAQTHFQHKMHQAGVDFFRIPQALFYHPIHAGARDLGVANQQLLDNGIDLREMWKRYEGTSPY